MSYTTSRQCLLPFSYNPENNLNEILKSTKGLIVNSAEYNTYLHNYMQKTQVMTFKLPDVTIYPLLKTDEMMTLSKSHYDTSKETPPKKTKVLKKSDSNVYDNRILQNITTTAKTHKKYKSSHFEGRQLNISLHKFQGHEMYVNAVDLGNTRNSLLGEIFDFDENLYNNLQYDESLIFYRQNFYENMIKERLKYIKTNQIENLTGELRKKYNTNTPNEITLTLQSLTVEFRNMSDHYKKPLCISFPFAYLPLFYYKDIEAFRYILLAIVQFNETFDDIHVKEEEIYHIINDIKEFDTDDNKESEQSHSDMQVNCNNGNSCEKNKPERSLLQKCQDNKRNHQQTKRFSSYCFFWNTPKVLYNVEVRLPEIYLTLDKQFKQVNKFIDTELFLFLYVNNFVNWDFYVCNYLLSIKAFRLFFENIFSKKKLLAKKYSDKVGKRPSFATLNKIKEFETIHLSQVNTKNYSESDTKFFFFYTNVRATNSIVVLHNYMLKVLDVSCEPKHEYEFHFNLAEMKLLIRLSEYQNLESFFRKLLLINEKEGTISIDYSLFDNFDESFFKYKTHAVKRNEESQNHIKLEMSPPSLERILYHDGNLVSNSREEKYYLPTNIMKTLIEESFQQWPMQLYEFKGHHLTTSPTLNNGIRPKKMRKSLAIEKSPFLGSRGL